MYDSGNGRAVLTLEHQDQAPVALGEELLLEILCRVSSPEIGLEVSP